MAWYIDSDINNGYPWNEGFPNSFKTGWTVEENIILPKIAWRISSGVNGGYPFIWYWFEDSGSSTGGEVNYNIDDFGDLDNKSVTSIFDPMHDFSLFTHGAIAYVLTSSQLADVLSEINVLYNSDPDTIQMQLDFKGSNPFDYIMGIFGIPINLSTTVQYPITIGPVTLNTTGSIYSQCYRIDFGTLSINPYFNDFRDYAPYTAIELFIPLCGTISLDTSLYMGHTISVDLICDLYTGSCIGRVYRDNLLDKVVNGTFACQIPITAANMGSYQNSIHNLQNAIKQQETQLMLSAITTAAGIAGGIMSGNPLALAGSLAGIAGIDKTSVNLDNLKYQSEHNAPSISSTSASDAVLGMNSAKLRPLLLYKRTQTVQGFNIDYYGHTVGYACNKQCLVSDISGYTVCSKINTNGIGATDEEIRMIENLFRSGVYL